MDYEELVFLQWLEEESQTAVDGYFSASKVELRQSAIRYVVYAMNKTESQGYDAVVPYFAMCYFDRFISRNNLPTVLENEQDNLCLLAFSCITIAWKMNFRKFKIAKLLHDMGESFCTKKIESMELLILKALQWRMQAVTAFYFLDYLCRARFCYTMTRGFNRQYVNRIVIQSQADANFTIFQPSVIAASCLLVATSIINDEDFAFILNTLMTSNHISKGDLLPCVHGLYSMNSRTEMLSESWNDWIPRSGGRAPLPPGSRLRPSEIVEQNGEDEPYVGEGSEHILETESMILRFEVCRWAGGHVGEELMAGLRRRREAKMKTRLPDESSRSQ